MNSEKELEFISGNFFEGNLEPHQRYLLKYFKTEIQVQFLRYYLKFGSMEHFVDHTGLFCRIRWRQLLLAKLKLLESKLQEARENMDMEMIALIESGKYR